MEFTKEKLKEAAKLNEMMMKEDPDTFETMVTLAMISAVANRAGEYEMAERSQELFNEAAMKFRRPVQ